MNYKETHKKQKHSTSNLQSTYQNGKKLIAIYGENIPLYFLMIKYKGKREKENFYIL